MVPARRTRFALLHLRRLFLQSAKVATTMVDNGDAEKAVTRKLRCVADSAARNHRSCRFMAAISSQDAEKTTLASNPGER